MVRLTLQALALWVAGLGVWVGGLWDTTCVSLCKSVFNNNSAFSFPGYFTRDTAYIHMYPSLL